MHTFSAKSLGRCLLLAGILGLYLFNVERWHPQAFFGVYQDDGFYFSTAKALAEGQGYRLISFPGSPHQTKYPILYPWLLSWVWKLNPRFPDNLKLAIHVTEFFGCWTLIATYFLLRRLEGLTERVAMFLTALIAFQPFFLRLSGLVMSDVPFVAFMLTALLLSRAALSARGRLPLMLFAGLVAGLSVGIRMVGVAVVAGILCSILRTKAWSKAYAFTFAAGVAALAISWPTIIHSAGSASLTTAGEPGWNQLLLNYTDYARFQWSVSIPSIWAFFRLVKLNFMVLLTSPGAIVAGPSATWGDRIMAALSAPIWLGMIRQERQPEWRPITYVLILYSAILLIWSYTIPDRFLLPFIPLFFAGLWCELRRLGAMLVAKLQPGPVVGQRILAGSLSLILGSMLAFIAWNYLLEDPKRLQVASAFQLRGLVEREQAYQWIREHTAPEDRFAAWEDATLYLYTGRQALRPIAIRPQAAYADDKLSLQQDLSHFCDAPRHVGVRYWFTKDDDFRLEADPEKVTARIAEIEAVLPVVFSSTANYVKIFDASCVADVGRPGCRAAAPVLFPP
jgi:4-amino-4-deoxy-L-arabinose transferase-like glycosyltransferase